MLYSVLKIGFCESLSDPKYFGAFWILLHLLSCLQSTCLFKMTVSISRCSFFWFLVTWPSNPKKDWNLEFLHSPHRCADVLKTFHILSSFDRPWIAWWPFLDEWMSVPPGAIFRLCCPRKTAVSRGVWPSIRTSIRPFVRWNFTETTSPEVPNENKFHEKHQGN